ncbi:ATP12 family chaperone protein [Rhizobium sp. TRM95796]|uniref:ATP12 family chaperone protein n=1 Tax=Rhizobium sp. TRM95796 TaxID=2979862 RepID=UPI0021E70C3E|nr:ATP12 family protein [Rhizobium sp. TRM95796]MCV3764244.1 ATPase [Rhizobium sp. TRM95796]
MSEDDQSLRDIFSDLAAPVLSDEDPTRRAQIQMKRPLPKRFYKDVSVQQTEGGHQILLDGRPVKTPMKSALVLPTAAAAGIVAAEWRAQGEEINPAKMPATRLANTAIDGIAREIDAVAEDIVSFAGTDLVCYRAEHPERLANLQAAHWDPVLFWAADDLGARFILVAGVMHQEQPPEALDAYRSALADHRHPLALAALHTITTLTGSALLALAFAKGRLDAEAAWTAAHVDEDFNIAQWGADAEAEARRKARWVEMKTAADLFGAMHQHQANETTDP